MAGQDGDIIAERKELFVDPANEQIAIASRQVPTSDAPGEKNVSSEEGVFVFPEEAKAAGTVPRHFEDSELQSLQSDRFRLSEKAICRDRLNLPAKAEALKKSWLGQHGSRFLVIGDLAAVFALNPGSIDDVIDMAVRKEKHFDSVSSARQPLRGILRCIDKNASDGDKKTVRVKDAAGECVHALGISFVIELGNTGGTRRNLPGGARNERAGCITV